MALLHYQFEAIHPFTDGNGRTGRILNVLFLCNQKLIDLPVIYLSKYILENKNDYYRLLREVTENGIGKTGLYLCSMQLKTLPQFTLDKVNLIYNSYLAAIEKVKTEAPEIYTHELDRSYLQPAVLQNCYT